MAASFREGKLGNRLGGVSALPVYTVTSPADLGKIPPPATMPVVYHPSDPRIYHPIYPMPGSTIPVILFNSVRE